MASAQIGSIPSAARLVQRSPVDVDADHLVAVQIRARERAEPAADVEHPSAGPDPIVKEHAPLRTAVDEVLRSPRLVMLAVDGLELLEPVHARKCARMVHR